jgi:hypothetical protein
MSQVMGAFGLLDFTILWPVLACSRFETYKMLISLIFLFLGRLKPWILNQWIRGHDSILKVIWRL